MPHLFLSTLLTSCLFLTPLKILLPPSITENEIFLKKPTPASTYQKSSLHTWLFHLLIRHSLKASPYNCTLHPTFSHLLKEFTPKLFPPSPIRPVFSFCCFLDLKTKKHQNYFDPTLSVPASKLYRKCSLKN